MSTLCGLSEVPIRWNAFEPEGADIRLFLADLDRAELNAEGVQLGNEEEARLEKLRDPLARSRFLARRILLRRVISTACGISACEVRYRYSRHGKPMVAELADGQPFHFNTSWSEGWYAIATSRSGPVGVDIETIARRVDHAQVLRIAASAEELEWHASARAECADLIANKIWVVKEAVLKAAGKGLQVNPRTISLPYDLVVSDMPRAWTRVHVATLESTFWVQLAVNDGIVLALARPGTIR